jgi:hypothetical protein
MVRNDSRSTARKTAEELHMTRETVRLNLTKDLNMKKVCPKMITKDLSGELKMWRRETLSHITARLLQETDVRKKMVTTDEALVFEYGPETKCQSLR